MTTASAPRTRSWSGGPHSSKPRDRTAPSRRATALPNTLRSMSASDGSMPPPGMSAQAGSVYATVNVMNEMSAGASLAHDRRLDRRHLCDRIADAFAPETTLLHAAERNVRRLELRTVVDDDGAGVQPADGVHRRRQATSEDAGLQREIGLIQVLDRIVDARDPDDGSNRTEGLFGDERRVARNEIKNCRPDLRLLAAAAAQHGGASR